MGPPPPAPIQAGGTSSPAQQQQRRTGQHAASPVSGMVPIVLVPMVPPATVRMGGAEFPAGQQLQHGGGAASRRIAAPAAAGRSPGQQARMSVSWCHPSTAALPERQGGVYRSPVRPAAAAAPRQRVTVSWCQPAGEAAVASAYRCGSGALLVGALSSSSFTPLVGETTVCSHMPAYHPARF
jgi:hypothetical protein